MKESLSEQAMLNALVADYLCSKAPKIGAKFKKETSANALEEYQTGLSEMVQHYLKTANEDKAASPEKEENGNVSKKQNGEAASADPKVEGKKEKGGEKKGKKKEASKDEPKAPVKGAEEDAKVKTKKAPEATSKVEPKAPTKEAEEEAKVKTKKAPKRKGGEDEVPKEPKEEKIDEKAQEVDNSAGVVEKKKKSKKKEEENRKEEEAKVKTKKAPKRK